MSDRSGSSQNERRSDLRVTPGPDSEDDEAEGGSSQGREQGAQGKGEGSEGGKRQQSRDGGGKQDRPHGKQGKAEDQSGQEAPSPPAWQWVIALVSSLVVLGLFGFLLYEAITGTGLPPMVSVRVERVIEIPNGYLVQVGVYNTGGSTAAALQIEGTLKRDTVTVETSTATIAFVPAEGEREAGLYFTKDPRQYRLEVRPMGYDHP